MFTWPNFAVVYQNWQISGILVLSTDLYLDLLGVKMICTANQLNCLMFLKGWEMLVIVKRTCYTKSIDCCLSQKQRSLYLHLFAWKQLFLDRSSQVTQLDLSFLHFWKADIHDMVQLHCLKKRQHYSTGHFLVQGSMNLQFGIDAPWVFCIFWSWIKGWQDNSLALGSSNLPTFHQLCS